MKQYYVIPTQVIFRDPYFEMDHPDHLEDEKGEFIGGIAYCNFIIEGEMGEALPIYAFDWEKLELREVREWGSISQEIIEKDAF